MSTYTNDSVRLFVDDLDGQVLDSAMIIAERVTNQEAIVKSIIDQLGKKDSISDKQWNLLQKLVRQIENPPTGVHPEGGGKITGVVTDVCEVSNRWGTKMQMSILDDRGFESEGSIPNNIRDVKIGDRLEVVATLKPTEGGYGRFTRPQYAEYHQRATQK